MKILFILIYFKSTTINHCGCLIPDGIHPHESMREEKPVFSLLMLSAKQGWFDNLILLLYHMRQKSEMQKFIMVRQHSSAEHENIHKNK